MIKGIGVDICEVDRFDRLVADERFMRRVFGARERDYILADGRRVEKAAGMFCAKEAFSKAVGTGLSGFSLTDVQIDHDPRGAPFFVLSGRAREKYGALSFALSISHGKTHAVAFVTASAPSGTGVSDA